MIRHIIPRAALFLALVGLTGCYRVTVRSGRAEAPGVPATDGATRGGIVNGIDEEKPLHAGMVCRDSFASVYIETSFLNGLANWYRGLYYHTQNVTLRCGTPKEELQGKVTDSAQEKGIGPQ